MAVKKLIVPSILGGVVLFLWGAVSHMVIGLGEIGIKPLPNQDSLVAAMKTDIAESGFYFFPWMTESPGMTKEQEEAAMQEWTKSYEAGPIGILIYHPKGTQPLSPRQMLTELITDIVVVLFAAFFMSRVSVGLTSLGSRVFFVALLGLFGHLVVDISYWNWYGFPGEYTVAAIAGDTIGFGLAGLVLAWRIKPGVSRT